MILKHTNLIKGVIVNRPSKINKSPYLVDVNVENKNYIAHSPALGMSGLIRPGVIVYMEKSNNTTTVSQFSIKIIENTNHSKIYIGANPILANTIVKNTFVNKNIFKNKILDNISKNISHWNSEVTVKDCNTCSRIDFRINNTYIEVKNVPLASYNIKNITQKIFDFYPKNQKLFVNLTNNYKLAVFPDGFTKKNNDLVSERAYKHLLTLEKLSKKFTSILIFTVLRKDCQYFIPNFIRDPKYSKKLKELIKKNIIKCFCFKYKITKNKNNFSYKFDKTLPIILDFNEKKYNYLTITKIKKLII